MSGTILAIILLGCRYPILTLHSGGIPRQLALEILDSLQSLLFPLHDIKSRNLLRSLVRAKKTAFDPETLNSDDTSIRNPDEQSVGYVYLAERISTLYSELEDPEPRTRLDKILQRKSKDRHVMAATLVGVLIALVLGFASLGLSAYQTYIAYQAWKHPGAMA